MIAEPINRLFGKIGKTINRFLINKNRLLKICPDRGNFVQLQKQQLSECESKKVSSFDLDSLNLIKIFKKIQTLEL